MEGSRGRTSATMAAARAPGRDGRGGWTGPSPVFAAQRLVGETRAEGAGATRNQDVLGHDPPLFACGAGGSVPPRPRRSARLAVREGARGATRESGSGEVSWGAQARKAPRLDCRAAIQCLRPCRRAIEAIPYLRGAGPLARIRRRRMMGSWIPSRRGRARDERIERRRGSRNAPSRRDMGSSPGNQTSRNRRSPSRRGVTTRCPPRGRVVCDVGRCPCGRRRLPRDAERAQQALARLRSSPMSPRRPEGGVKMLPIKLLRAPPRRSASLKIASGFLGRPPWWRGARDAFSVTSSVRAREGRARVAVAAPIVFEAAQDGADQLAGIVAVTPLTGREPDAQREREALEVLHPGFVQTVRVEFHSRADL